MSVLRRGAEGESVSDMQEQLSRLGFDLDVDGVFGKDTEHAVIAMQVIFGLDVDGQVGPATSKLIGEQLEAGWHTEAARLASK